MWVPVRFDSRKSIGYHGWALLRIADQCPTEQRISADV